MAQKTKVKELVGRSLNSYHTNALQQIERIEKKNKEQNHKINILTGELDKDYITKTAEGSVISLDHSKEGMVYLDELQGNTLVNYCTDGSNEMTLNGDIDVEGTFVTTTEGVDNGKVDVMCEGNTLVNLMPNINTDDKYYKHTAQYDWYTSPYRTNAHKLKPSTKYTVILDILEYTLTSENAFHLSVDHNNQNAFVENIYVKSKGCYVRTLTTKAELVDTMLAPRQQIAKADDGYIKYRMILLEGDWTNKEIPSYFEGMKSVGQDDENGHKIEILSENDNLWRGKEIYYPNNCKIIQSSDNEIIFESVSVNQGLKVNIQRFRNKKLSLSYDMEVLSGTVLNFGGHNRHIDLGMYIDGVKVGNIYHGGYTKNYEIGRKYRIEVILNIDNNVGQNGTIHQIQDRGEIGIEPNRYTGDNPQNCRVKVSNFVLKEITNYETPAQYFQPKYNKKEILINEPLRSTPNTKDRFVKIGNKWFIERNCKQVRLELKSGGLLEELETEDTIVAGIWNYSDKKYHKKNIINHINDTFADVADRSNQNEYIYSDGWNINFFIRIKKSRLTENTLQGVKNWLQNNPINLVYELATPTYEPLELEPVLNTYNDITHISNNSIISCNMKIKNSGYNAIIKPSTLYTVALDTNKSGTIGMDLGGAKVTTINNVATITTPATLSDDSLRLYGKGINGSKVRLLEGDKTNWIPSFFEGMKSSFEDKLQDDGSYKMEILMNNENLLDLSQHSINTPYTNQYKIENNTIFGTYIGDNYTDFQLWFKLKRNKTYKLSWDISSTYILNGANSQLLKGKLNGYNADSMLLNSYDVATGIISNLPCDGWYTLHFHSMRNNQFIKNLQLKLVDISTNFTERKFNKIQFSSIEPLRGVGDFKDKFVFKDGKLMIERNCKVTILDETFNYTNWGNGSQAGYFTCHANNYLQGEFVFNQKNTISKEFTIGGGLGQQQTIGYYKSNPHITVRTTIASSTTEFKEWIKNNNITLLHALAEPTYEEVPFELQKIILEGYENGTLFFDTNIPPTATVTYAGETPIVKSVKLNKTEVSNNTADINDNILPYLMDMDYRIVMLQLATEELEGEVSMARLFGRTYEMLKRDILSKRLSRQEYGYRLADYFNAGKLTEEQVRELEELR